MVSFLVSLPEGIAREMNEHDPLIHDLPDSKMMKTDGISIAMFDHQRSTSGFPYH